MVFIAAAVLVSRKAVGPEVKLPLLVTCGVLVLLIALGLLALLYSDRGLARGEHALALPEGSVRAVIALSLVLLFAIVSIFLYGSMANGSTETIRNLTYNQARDLSMVPGAEVQPPLPREGSEFARAEAANTASRYEVTYRVPNSPASDDLAKQLIVLLGTLVTAVASFYFGANSVQSAANTVANVLRPGDGLISLTEVRPSSLLPGPQAQPLTLTGSNLDRVKSVKLKKDDAVIDVADFRATPTQINFSLTVTAQLGGKWDVAASDGSTEVRLKQALEVRSAAPAPAEPKPSGIRPNPLTRTATELTLTGENLAQIKFVELRKEGAVPIRAEAKKPATPTEVKCSLAIPQGSEGPWQAVANDGIKDYQVPGAVTIQNG